MFLTDAATVVVLLWGGRVFAPHFTDEETEEESAHAHRVTMNRAISLESCPGGRSPRPSSFLQHRSDQGTVGLSESPGSWTEKYLPVFCAMSKGCKAILNSTFPVLISQLSNHGAKTWRFQPRACLLASFSQ